MAGTLPTSPAFQTLTINNNQPNLVTITSSGRRQVKSQAAQFWSFNASYPPMKRSDWAPIAAFITKQKGATENFTVILPEYSDTQGALTTQTVNVTTTEPVGETSIALNSGSINVTDALKAGDFVKFSNHNKVYMVTDDVDFSSGSATMNIEPGLLASISNTPTQNTLVYKNVEFTVYLGDAIQEWNTGLANMVEYELELREAI
jgi:hypothetical protein